MFILEIRTLLDVTKKIFINYLQNRAVDKILLQESLRCHVIHDGGGQVVQDAVHGVAWLLAGYSQVLLQGASN